MDQELLSCTLFEHLCLIPFKIFRVISVNRIFGVTYHVESTPFVPIFVPYSKMPLSSHL